MLKAFKIKYTMPPKQTLLEVLFPKTRAEIFRLLFGTKRRPRYVREIMGDSSMALRSIQDELKRLNAVGVIASHSDGFRRFFAANTAHPLFREIMRIAELSERLPAAKCSDFVRSSRTRKRRPSRIKIRERLNREPNWGLNKRPFKS